MNERSAIVLPEVVYIYDTASLRFEELENSLVDISHCSGILFDVHRSQVVRVIRILKHVQEMLILAEVAPRALVETLCVQHVGIGR